MMIFHHHVMPLMCDEIANNGIDSFAENFYIREHVLDRASNAVQAFSRFLMFAGEITDLRSSIRIAFSFLCKDQLFLGVVIDFR